MEVDNEEYMEEFSQKYETDIKDKEMQEIEDDISEQLQETKVLTKEQRVIEIKKLMQNHNLSLEEARLL